MSAPTESYTSRFSIWSGPSTENIFSRLRPVGPPAPGKELAWKDDLANPQNWTMRRKMSNFLLSATVAFSCTMASTIYTPAIPQIELHFQCSQTLAILPYSLYILGIAFGPLISSPYSAALGRRSVYLSSMPIFGLFIFGAALSQNIATLAILRFFAGVFGSPALSNGFSMIEEVWIPKERLIPCALYVGASFFGPTVGPMLGGFVLSRADWRWIHWTTIFLALALFPLVYFFLHETSRKRISCLQVQHLEKSTELWPTISEVREYLSKLFHTVLVLPFQSLVTQPDVLLLGLYVGLNSAIQYALYVSLPSIFEQKYNFNWIEQGLALLSLGVGAGLGLLFYLVQERYLYQRLLSHKTSQESDLPSGDELATFLPPKYRLLPAMSSTILLPTSLLIFALTVTQNLSPLLCLGSLSFFNAFNLVIFISTTIYLAESYGPFSTSSALAAATLLIYLIGATFPLFINNLFKSLQIREGLAVLAVLEALGGFVPLGVYISKS